MRTLRRKERLKNLLSHVVRHTHAVIAEGQHQPRVFTPARDEKLASLRHRIDSIHDEIDEHLAQFRSAAVCAESLFSIEFDFVFKSTNASLVLPARARDLD